MHAHTGDSPRLKLNTLAHHLSRQQSVIHTHASSCVCMLLTSVAVVLSVQPITLYEVELAVVFEDGDGACGARSAQMLTRSNLCCMFLCY
jgi:hypothetical protein